jgi:hypothetical protein
MKIAKKYKTFLCDDIRQEVGNKISLMGIYGKDVVVESTPIVLRSIILVIMLEDIINPFPGLFIKVFMPGMEKPIMIKAEKPAGLKVGMDANISAIIAPFAIKEAGPAKFEVRFSENDKPWIVHKFNVKVA